MQNCSVTASSSSASEDGHLLPRAIADAAAVAAGIPLGPDGVFVTAVATPYLEAVFQWAWDKFGEDSKNRILGMLARAWHVTGMNSERFARRIDKNAQTRLLTATAVKGAASTAFSPKVAAIGNLLAKGLIASDEDKIDIVALELAAMAEMERPHVSLLDLLVNYRPTMFGSIPWQAGLRKWTAREITDARPNLGPVLDGLMGTLIRHGLAIENNEAGEALEQALAGLENRGREQAGQIRAGSRLTAGMLQPYIPEVSRIERTWSPTELGERLLNAYREAGENTSPVGEQG